MNDSTDIELRDDPWMSRAFISKLTTQVSLLYGKNPRLFEMYSCTMVKSGDPSFDPEMRTLDLGAAFRIPSFLPLAGGAGAFLMNLDS
ncbi:hypothetical protein QRX46_07850 [Bifidobacterium sp. H1HS10N]|uniref:hypothetical protein n=1 Tax=Bifidobacterium kimbladii TaxID=1293826 RepID=UPI0028BDBC47|nr:hypothetical protein [Bifidobacterium sp. H1HS10N]MDT7513328.1 hypothetical protein [Bifidobacterium sp. H1HS10N]